MASSGSYTLLGITIICYLLGMAGIIAGVLGPAWLVRDSSLALSLNEQKEEEGLLKTCGPTVTNRQQSTCRERPDILKFVQSDELHKEKDVILMIMIISLVLCFIAIVLSLTMICCRRRQASWRCGALATFIFGLLAAIVGLAGLGYAESEFKNNWNSAEHGWSNITCWVGCAGIILGTILSLLMCFVVPGSSSNDKNVGVHYVGNRNPTYQHDYAGY